MKSTFVGINRAVLYSLNFLIFFSIFGHKDWVHAKDQNNIHQGVPSMSRPQPPEVNPVIIEGISYEQKFEHEGVLFAIGVKSKKEIWRLRIWPSKGASEHSPRTQPVFFSSLQQTKDKESLDIADERGFKYQVDLKMRTVKILVFPVQLDLVSKVKNSESWSIKVGLYLLNTRETPIDLDGPSLAEGGKLIQDLFEVIADGKRLSYVGKIKKRSKPENFIVLNSGQSFSTEVDFSEGYKIPLSVKTLEVRFSQQNHFSKDNFQMESDFLKVL